MLKRRVRRKLLAVSAVLMTVFIVFAANAGAYGPGQGLKALIRWFLGG